MTDESERCGNDAAVLARVLAGLRDGWPTHVVRDGVRAGLPGAPAWATHSVIEDGGVTHELVSPSHPLAWFDRQSAGPGPTCPTDVSVSVVDRPGALRWVRLPPTIQVEGGSYPLLEARRLARAIHTLVGLVS